MGFLADTTAIVHLLRDRSGLLGPRYDALVAGHDVFLSGVTEFELLKGARDDNEWRRLLALLAGERIIDCEQHHWLSAARMIFDLRRLGVTLKNPIDALIAQVALEAKLTIIHDDRDFELIASVSPLTLARFGAEGSNP